MTEEIVGTVVGGIIIAVLGWAWHKREFLRRWWAGQTARASREEQSTAADQLEVLRGQVIDVARARGKVLPESSTGQGNPTVITFSDCQQTTFYADYVKYMRAMQSGRVNPVRTMRAQAPVPVSQWNRVRLEQWLTDHTD